MRNGGTFFSLLLTVFAAMPLQACAQQAAPPVAYPSSKNVAEEALPRAGQAPQTPQGPSSSQLVIEARVTLRVSHPVTAAQKIGTKAAALQGRVVTEELLGGDRPGSASKVKLRIPPARLNGLIDWLSSVGHVENKRVNTQDVSRELFDGEIALQNLTLTLERLRQLLQKESIAVADVLAIEKEMSRVRGEIERLKGEQRWLKDRVAFSTLEITLIRQEVEAVFAPEKKFNPGARLSHLFFFESSQRLEHPLGGGFSLHFARAFNLAIDVFPKQPNEKVVLLADVGGAVYSDFLGRGQRRFLNPYLGLRMGYGYLAGEDKFLLAGEVGLELFKNKFLLVDLAARVVGLINGDRSSAALGSSLGINVPF